MKAFLFTVACALITPLVSANIMLRSNGEDYYYDPIGQCQSEGNEESCQAISGCVWRVGKCFYKIEEKCGFAGDEEACGILSTCIWMPNNRSGGKCKDKTEETCGFVSDEESCRIMNDCIWMSNESGSKDGGKCTEKKEVMEKCSFPELRIQSQSACNSVKGCSWARGAEACVVAPKQLDCDGYTTKKTCEEQACLFRKRKNGTKICMGRWENEFLKGLKKMDGEEAKKAIENEYGEGTYSVVLIEPGNKKDRREPRARNRTRIKVFLNKKGLVKRTPKIG